MRLDLFILCAFLLGCSHSIDAADLEQSLDELFSSYTDQMGPGYAIGIIRGDELILTKGYGYANLQSKEPISADTVFNLASLSKQFTAAAIALELQKGTITLDDPLAMYWKGLPDFMSDITIGHLLYMTSGLKEYYTLPSPKGGWSSENEFTTTHAITAVLESGELEYKPGTAWTYSNINYQLLAELSAKLNAQSFAKHLDITIFDPLEMKNSWVDADLLTNHTNQARSYVWSEDDANWRIAPRLSAHYGGSGVFSSINDLVKWNKELFGHGRLGTMFSEQMLSTRKYEHDKSNDAFGLVHGSYRGHSTIWYEGGDYGVSTYIVHMPERYETIICLSNFGNGSCGEKTRAIIDILID